MVGGSTLLVESLVLLGIVFWEHLSLIAGLIGVSQIKGSLERGLPVFLKMKRT